MSLLSDTLALYKREMLIFRANIRVNLIRTAIFPLFILLIFGATGQGINNVPVVVVNYANNMQSQQFINSLGSQGIMSVESVTNQNDALALLDAGKVSFVIVILPNFPTYNGQSAVRIYYSNTQYSVTSEILPMIEQRAALFAGPGNYQVKQYLPSSTFGAALSTPVNGANGSETDFIFSGVIGMIVVFSALFAGGMGLITDRNAGFIKAYLVAPINKAAILFGRVLAGSVQSILYITVVLLIGLIFGSQIAMGWTGLFWIFLLGMILMVCFTSVSAILASRLKNVTSFAIFAQAVGLPLWFLAGGIVPVSSLPSTLQTLSIIDPMTYAVDGFRWVILVGTYPLANMITDISVLLGFAIVSTLLSVILFKSTID